MSLLKIENYKPLQVIGFGSFSKVIAAQHDEKIYAIKVVKKRRAIDTYQGVMEKDLLIKSDHPFLIKMISCFTLPNHFCFVLEYAPGGDLLYYVHRHGKALPEQNVVFYAAETALAINFLHSKNIIHRDVKLKNILIALDGHIKLTDFGSGRELELEGRANSFKGTPFYISPEIIRHEGYNHVTDFWSFGVCVYVLIYGRNPFPNLDIYYSHIQTKSDAIIKQIVYPKSISESAISLLKGLLDGNPNERLGKQFSEIRMHSFFKEIDWEEVEAKQVKPPFIPVLKESTDFSNFDCDNAYNTKDLSIYEAPKEGEQKEFEDFDYISPDWKD